MNSEEERLRRALTVEAAKVDVEARALTEIRKKIQARRRRWWLPSATPAGRWLTGAAVALTASVAVLVIGFGGWVQRPFPPPDDGSAATSADPTAIGGFGASVGPSGVLALGLPVYYLGTTSDGPVLYREFHQRPGGDGSPVTRTTEAVTAMLTERAFDPDYTSRWPATARLRGVTVEDGVVTVDLAGAAVNGVDPVSAAQTVQQLIWTATAASGLTGVRLLLDGQPVDTLWGTVAVAGVLRRMPAAQAQAPVWLIDPQYGGTVGKAFTVRLAGIVAGGTVGLRVRDVTHAVVVEQTVQLTKVAPEPGEGSVKITLPSGTYTVEAFYGSPTDGGEQGLDNHTITVR
jgi:hypothetical protein